MKRYLVISGAVGLASSPIGLPITMSALPLASITEPSDWVSIVHRRIGIFELAGRALILSIRRKPLWPGIIASVITISGASLTMIRKASSVLKADIKTYSVLRRNRSIISCVKLSSSTSNSRYFDEPRDVWLLLSIVVTQVLSLPCNRAAKA